MRLLNHPQFNALLQSVCARAINHYNVRMLIDKIIIQFMHTIIIQKTKTKHIINQLQVQWFAYQI